MFVGKATRLADRCLGTLVNNIMASSLKKVLWRCLTLTLCYLP